jgi:hypothetical protein
MAQKPSSRSQARSSRSQSQIPKMIVIRPIVDALSLWECSANIEILLSQPDGLREPFERGQSGNAMPALMLVVNAPRATKTKTQAAPTAAKTASAGL